MLSYGHKWVYTVVNTGVPIFRHYIDYSLTPERYLDLNLPDYSVYCPALQPVRSHFLILEEFQQGKRFTHSVSILTISGWWIIVEVSPPAYSIGA